MKTRESGMPPEEMWSGFFDPFTVLKKLELTANCRDVLEFGCGYGTFTIPAAQIIHGSIHALDIDPEMIEAANAKVLSSKVPNVNLQLRDFILRSAVPVTGGVCCVTILAVQGRIDSQFSCSFQEANR